jgi:hypothetical protein
MAGGVYDTTVDGDDNALVWLPTDTNQRWSRPTPATLLHVIVVCDGDTTHSVAVYCVPSAPPYHAIADSAGSPDGPKFDPVMTTVSPPDVDSVEPDANATDVIVGAVYDTTADGDDNALVWLPTDTNQRWSRPTPATLVHVSVVCDMVTTQSVATYCVPSTPP